MIFLKKRVCQLYTYSDDFDETETTIDQFLFTDEITEDSDTCNITYVQDSICRMSTDMFPENTCY